MRHERDERIPDLVNKAFSNERDQFDFRYLDLEALNRLDLRKVLHHEHDALRPRS